MKKILLLLCFTLLIGQSYAQKWDATFQSSTVGGPSVGVNAIVEFNGDMYVAGSWSVALSTYVQKWDGTEWSVVGSGFSENLISGAGIQALEVFNGELYAAGLFTIDIGGTSHYSLIKLNTVSGEWEAVSGFPSTNAGMRVYDLDKYNGNLMIGGKFSDLFGGSDLIDNIVGYNGTNWVPFDQGVEQGEVFSMDEHNNEFYIAGKFTKDGANVTFYDNIAKWDGVNSVWVNVGALATYSNSGYFTDIKSYGSHIYAYNVKDDIFNSFRPFLKWEPGGAISQINVVSVTPEYSRLANLNDMIVYDGNLIVGGYYLNSPSGGQASPIQIESYDGTTWNKALPGGASAGTLGIYDGKLTTGTYSLQDPSMEFTADNTKPCAGESVTYSLVDYSSDPASSFTWTFEGGTPATSTDDPSPVVTYAADGEYDVSIEVTSSDGTNTVMRRNYIQLDNAINITTQPVDVINCSGDNANFFIVRDFGNNITQQWQVDDGSGYVDIDGATNTSFTTSSSLDKNGYKYKCKVTRCNNIVFSSEALLTINETPEITGQPQARAVCLTGNGTFTIEVAVGAGTPTYQWQYRVSGSTYSDLSDGGVYSGVTTKTLAYTGVDNSLPELFENDNSDGITSARFRCIVSANGCDINSSDAVLTIHDAPTVTLQPINAEGLCDTGSGVSTDFEINTSLNAGGFSFQWQVDEGSGSGFVNIADNTIYSGTDTRILSLSGATSALNGNLYRCEIGACAVPVYSDAASITIDDVPIVVQQPVASTICDGSDTEFTVTVSGGSSLSYQWQFSTGSGSYTDILVNDNTYFASDGTLQITGATTALNNYRYRCVISSGTSCELISSNGQLRVYSQPTLTSNTPSNALSVCDGGSTILRVNPSSTTGIGGAFTYQWQVDAFDLGFVDLSDDNNYSGTTTKNLSIDVAPFSFNGNKYRCVIRGCVTENASPEETLVVLQLPLVTTSPESQTVCNGQPVTFTAVATGSDLTYTWWRDMGDGNYSQQTSANASPDYTFTAVSGFNGYKYKCVAQAGSCTASTAESFEATLTVHETQISAVSENDISICAGESATFSVTMTNPDGISFQWSDANGDLTDGNVYTGVTTSSLNINAPTSAINNYTVAITGDCGNTSFNYQLLVYGLGTPEIEAQLGDPANPQLFVTNTNIFQLGVDNFEWYLDGNSYQSSGTNASITIDQAGSYTVVATKDNCEHPESEAVVIIVTGFENGLSANEVSVYPNPVNNKLTLKMGADFRVENKTKIILTNVAGKEVYNKIYNSLFNGQEEIDMSNYESGIYLVRIINGDKTTQYKIRKQ